MTDPQEFKEEPETEGESDPLQLDSDGEVKVKKERPALTIVIQSWATPIAGLVMLVVGLAAGFFLRPVVVPERAMITEVVNPSQPTAAAAVTNPNSEEMMQVVAEQTKHFIGSETAPVTLIEFSDYQ